jgi:hypothetical protein
MSCNDEYQQADRHEQQVVKPSLRSIPLAVCLALIVSPALVLAHVQYRIVGTVSAITTTAIDVRQSKDGQIISIVMDSETRLMRDKKAVSVREVIVGSRVEVDACGDSLMDLWAMEIRLVRPPTRP